MAAAAGDTQALYELVQWLRAMRLWVPKTRLTPADLLLRC
jgi:hypothetical protein